MQLNISTGLTLILELIKKENTCKMSRKHVIKKEYVYIYKKPTSAIFTDITGPYRDGVFPLDFTPIQ